MHRFKSINIDPRRRRAGLAWAAAGCFVLTAGCGVGNESPQFRLNMQDIISGSQDTLDISDFRASGKEDDVRVQNYKKLEFIVSALKAGFGTPDEPYLYEEVRWNPETKTGLELKKIELASGPYVGVEDPRAGRQRGLFRQHCVHCHGVTGDGAGPTAAFLNPYPRDYRQGVFKFKSTERAAKPTNADLKRTLLEGIPGTAMPSFALLPNEEVEALVEYVKYLSLRGMVEFDMAMSLLVNDEEIEPTKEAVLEVVQRNLDQWAQAEQNVIRPLEPSPHDTPEQLAASIKRGREIFLSKEAQCVKCHGPNAMGDNEEVLFDDWNKNKKPQNMAIWLLPPQELKPRNLRLGIYRGGRRPLDLYRRVHAGIPGTGMPTFGSSEGGNKPVLSPEDIWHVVDYVRSLPYEAVNHPPQAVAQAQFQHEHE